MKQDNTIKEALEELSTLTTELEQENNHNESFTLREYVNRHNTQLGWLLFELDSLKRHEKYKIQKATEIIKKEIGEELTPEEEQEIRAVAEEFITEKRIELEEILRKEEQ